MRYLRYLALLGICILPAAVPAHAQRVAVGIGIGGPVYGTGYGYAAPGCAYGYYGYYPYACAPYGYYGPDWFSGGLFIGARPWFRGGFRGREYFGPGFRGRGPAFAGRGGFGSRGFVGGQFRGGFAPRAQF